MSRLRPTVTVAREREYLRPDGPWQVPSLDDVLRASASSARAPAGAVLVDGAMRLTADDLETRIARLAGGLRGRGVERGDAVAWQLPNWHESVLLYRACWRLGAVAVPVHHRALDADVAGILERTAPAVLLAAPALPLASSRGAIEIRGDGGFEALGDSDPVTEGAAVGSDLACVLFTSGSSGAPKGVLHTHRTLGSKALLMREIHGLVPSDVVLMPAPLAHVSGLLNGILVPGVVPMPSVLMERWVPDDALDLIESERVSFMVGPPTFFVQMVATPAFDPGRVGSLRLISSGGAGVTPSFVDQASEQFGAVVKRTYGSTEAPTIATSHAGDDPTRARETDGRATGDVELRVVDPDTGSDLPAGEAGELWVRGPEVCVGYLDEHQTAEAFTGGGWFRTGDLATLDADGWLTIVGRLKDVIIRGGENVSASEVEGLLERHPVVRHAVAVGYPDDVLGERVAAFVVADGPFDLETCRAWFSDQGVARYKTPERVELVDELPVLPSGKPDRASLRERLALGPADPSG